MMVYMNFTIKTIDLDEENFKFFKETIKDSSVDILNNNLVYP